MIRVTYDGGDGSIESVECDQFHHHDDSRPFAICLITDESGDHVQRKVRVHEDRIITTGEVRNDE
jgi:hypothetical protein